MRPIRALVLCAAPSENATLSYQRGWPRAFTTHPSFEAAVVDVQAAGPLAVLRRTRALRSRFDVIVLLHSVFSNNRYLGARLAQQLRDLRQPKAYFIGNEYKLMPEKLAFAEEVGVSLLVSQLPSPRVHRLYAERLLCEVAYLPSAGLDSDLFRPAVPRGEREIDLGYRGYRSPLYLGHDERALIVERVGAAAGRRGLRTDLSLDRSDRFDEAGWSRFLNRCRGQLGTEAGGDYFELTDETRKTVNAYVDEHPDAGIEVIRARFFAGYEDPIPGRALSGRIVEAAGTKTVQVLLEGGYGGYFRPDVHYIPVRKDFSNLDDVLDALEDDALCVRISDAAYEVAVGELTYGRLIDRFRASLEQVL